LASFVEFLDDETSTPDVVDEVLDILELLEATRFKLASSFFFMSEWSSLPLESTFCQFCFDGFFGLVDCLRDLWLVVAWHAIDFSRLRTITLDLFMTPRADAPRLICLLGDGLFCSLSLRESDEEDLLGIFDKKYFQILVNQ
jgi:hypothetical protein